MCTTHTCVICSIVLTLLLIFLMIRLSHTFGIFSLIETILRIDTGAIMIIIIFIFIILIYLAISIVMVSIFLPHSCLLLITILLYNVVFIWFLNYQIITDQIWPRKGRLLIFAGHCHIWGDFKQRTDFVFCTCKSSLIIVKHTSRHIVLIRIWYVSKT